MHYTDDGVDGRINWANEVSVICVRKGNHFAEDEVSGELKNLGPRCVEGETPYEPDVLVRLEARKAGKKDAPSRPRTSRRIAPACRLGRASPGPDFENLARSLLGLRGTTQAEPPTDDEVSQHDAEMPGRAEQEARPVEPAAEDTARSGQVDSAAKLERLGKELMLAAKGRLTAKDLTRVRKAYATRRGQRWAEEELAQRQRRACRSMTAVAPTSAASPRTCAPRGVFNLERVMRMSRELRPCGRSQSQLRRRPPATTLRVPGRSRRMYASTCHL